MWEQTQLIGLGVAAIAIFFGVGLLLNGWSMKLACRICGVDDIGLGYAILIAIGSGLAGIAASAAVSIGMPKPSPMLAFLAPLIAMTVAIALLVRRNPLRAFGIYLLHSILSTIATLIVIVPLVIAAAFLIPAEAKEKFSNATSRSLASSTPIAALRELHESGELAIAPVTADDSAETSPEATTAKMDAADWSELEQALYQVSPVQSSPAAESSAPKAEPPMPKALMPPGVERNPFVK